MITSNKDSQQANTQKKQNTHLVNEAIRFSPLFVIDENGNNLGEMKRNDALNLAFSKGLDLVIVGKKGNINVAKILDFGKFKYEQKRKQKESKKNQTIIKVKEIKIKPMIGDHDLKVRAENAKRWLTDKDNVKFVIEARGRMITKEEFITQAYEKFIELIKDFGVVTQANKKVSAFRFETIIEPIKNK